MNRSPRDEKTNRNNGVSENPWKNFADLPKPEGNVLGFAGALYGLASVALPLSFLYRWFAVAAWVILLAGGFFLNRKARSCAILTLVLSVFAYSVPFLFGKNLPAVGAVASALCVGVMCGTFVQTSTRKFWIPVLLSACAAGAAFALSRDWLLALTALSLLPAVLLLSVATDRGEYRTTAVCYAEGGLLLAVLALGALWIFRTYGSLHPDTVRSVFAGWQENTAQWGIGFREQYIALLQEMAEISGVDATQLAAIIQEYRANMSDDLMRTMASVIFDYLPAFILVVCSIPAFFAQKMLNSAYVSNGMGAVLTPEAEFFTMSLPAAVIYILSTVITLCFSSSNIAVAVAGNLSVILLPGFLLVGLRVLRNRFSRSSAGLFWGLIIVAVVVFCCTGSGYFLLYFIALYGAYARIFSAVRHKMEDMNRDRDE